ncbi:MAG: ACT domain-containing protein, partial [Acidimicrobiales bacterium]
MPRFSLSAVGADRPGIVAAVSGVLVDLGCNLEDSTMTILQGHFAVLLVVSAAPGVAPGALEAALAPVAAAFDHVVALRPLGELDEEPARGREAV